MSEMRQRWRLTIRRGAEARDVAHRDVVGSWEAALLASGLPLAQTESARPRPRIAFAAPMPVGMLGERELIDLGLTECRLAADVRQSVAQAAPAGFSLVDLHDVWTGAPTLPSLVVAADYRASVAARGANPGEDELDVAVTGLLASPRIEVQRDKGRAPITVDIRPLVMRLRRVTFGDEGSLGLWMRLRLGGAGGVGRPEEVVSDVGRRLGRPLRIVEVVRERIRLADDAPDADPELT
jgi:radical SAM-linked protein